MKKEVLFRVFRIVLVILFLLVASSVRNVTKESYEEAYKIKESLSASLQVVKLADGDIFGMPLSDEEAVQNKGYKIKITNSSNHDKTFTIALISNVKNKEDAISFSDIRYQIKKDNKVVITSNLDENGYLYNDTLKSSSFCNYEIKFWIDEDVNTNLDGKTFSSKIAII